MTRSLVIASILATISLPAPASITMDFGTTSLPDTPFTAPFFERNNDSLPISTAAQANALFLGQGYQVNTVNFNYPDYTPFSQDFEVATGLPTAATNLQLVGQYGMSGVDTAQFQNAASFTATLPMRDRISGLLNNTSNGVVSFLFMDNINTFSLEILDKGIEVGDNRGGSVLFSFFGRDGTLLQAIPWPKALNGSLVFRSDQINIAGVQIQHEDPMGLLYQVLRFGVEVPAPAPVVLLVTGLTALGLTRRRRVGGGGGADGTGFGPGRAGH